MITLTLIRRTDKPWLYLATLGGMGGEHLTASDQPIVDAARILINRGYSSDTPLTARHYGSDVDAFLPLPLSEWARTTYSEPNAGGPYRAKWVARLSGDIKSGVSDDSPVPQAQK